LKNNNWLAILKLDVAM